MSKVLLRESIDITKPLTVTAEDVGKVVGVDEDGNIALVEGGGSGGVFYCQYNPETYGITASFNDIAAAVNSGKVVMLKTWGEDISEEGSIMLSYLGQTIAHTNDYSVTFVNFFEATVSFVSTDPDEPMGPEEGE